MKNKVQRKCFCCGKWVRLWDCITEGYICYDCEAIEDKQVSITPKYELKG